jgi:hypothetical protein
VFRTSHDSVVNLSCSDVTKKVRLSSINLSTSIDYKELNSRINFMMLLNLEKL